MPSFQDFSVSAGQTTQANVREIVVSTLVQDDQGNTIADFTGANVLVLAFGGSFDAFTLDQLMSIVVDYGMVQVAVAMKVGV